MKHAHNPQVVLLGLGALLPMALQAAEKLELKRLLRGHQSRSVKPLDGDLIEFFARSVDVVVTLEDHVLSGGFGSAVMEELQRRNVLVPMVRIGWPDAFVEHGKPDALRAKSGISVENTVEQVLPLLRSGAILSP